MNDININTTKNLTIDELDDADIEIGVRGGGSSSRTQQTPSDSKFVDVFYTEVSNVKTLIADISANTDTLESLYNKYSSSVKNNKKLAELREQIEKLRNENSNKSEKVKNSLQAIAKGNMDMAKKEEKSGGKSAELRIRENQHAALAAEFMDVIKRYQKVQADHKEAHRQDLKRLVKIADNKLSEEQAEDIVDSPDFREEEFFAQQILRTAAASTAKAVYNEMKETRDDLLKLEESMRELKEMFQDMYNLILLQQDLIDNIEQNVMKANDYVEKAIDDIKTAKTYQKKGSCCSAALIMVILLIVVGVIIAVLIVSGSILGLLSFYNKL